MPVLDVVSDVVCPWCFVGKKRVEKALGLLGKENWEIHWKPFQLNPGAPSEGMDRQEYRARKFGSLEVSRQLEGRVASAGAIDGVDFRFDLIKRTPNTLEAHRLIWLAGREGRQDEVVESLFEAYFLQGRDVGDGAVLLEIASQCGLDGRELEEENSGRLEVLLEEEEARKMGVSSVPSFVVNGVLVTSGAHPPESLARMFQEALG